MRSRNSRRLRLGYPVGIAALCAEMFAHLRIDAEFIAGPGALALPRTVVRGRGPSRSCYPLVKLGAHIAHAVAQAVVRRAVARDAVAVHRAHRETQVFGRLAVVQVFGSSSQCRFLRGAPFRRSAIPGAPRRGHDTRCDALVEGIGAAGGLAEDDARKPPRLVGRGLAVLADHDPLVGRLPAAVAGAVVDDEGLGATGTDAHAEAGQLVVPGDPGLVGRLERIDDPLGERGAQPGRPLSGSRRHRIRSVVGWRSRTHVHAATQPSGMDRQAPTRDRNVKAWPGMALPQPGGESG